MVFKEKIKIDALETIVCLLSEVMTLCLFNSTVKCCVLQICFFGFEEIRAFYFEACLIDVSFGGQQWLIIVVQFLNVFCCGRGIPIANWGAFEIDSK